MTIVLSLTRSFLNKIVHAMFHQDLAISIQLSHLRSISIVMPSEEDQKALQDGKALFAIDEGLECDKVSENCFAD